jgi:hypothetical protein
LNLQRSQLQLPLHGKKSLDNSVASIEAGPEDDEVPPPPQPKTNPNPTPTASIPHGSRKLPTAAEVDAITTSFNSYRSAQFHGLLTSLLQDVSPSPDVLPPVENILRELHVFLTGLERVEGMHPLEAAGKLEEGSSKSGKKKEKEKEKGKGKGVKITWPDPAPMEETKYTVGFEPPTVEGIYLAGSFAGAEGKKTLVRSRQGTFCADLVVEIPKVSHSSRQMGGLFTSNLNSDFTPRERLPQFESLPCPCILLGTSRLADCQEEIPTEGQSPSMVRLSRWGYTKD